jgi:phenol hydroxylase P5 protein
MAKEWYPVKLTKIDEYSPTVRNFHFQFLKPRFDFVSGQFVMVEVPKPGEKPVRKPYSIASPPYFAEKIELCIKWVEGGFVSTWFFNLKVGDEFPVQGPLGVFRLVEPLPEHLIFVATGTGIAPLRAQFLQLLHDGYKKPMTFIFGNRHEDEIPFHQELLDLAKKHSNFNYIPIISRPKSWGGEKGYVQEVIRKKFANPTGHHVYICGLVPMVNDLNACLTELGYPKESIRFEKWT